MRTDWSGSYGRMRLPVLLDIDHNVEIPSKCKADEVRVDMHGVRRDALSARVRPRSKYAQNCWKGADCNYAQG